jgi:hypothetical protein
MLVLRGREEEVSCNSKRAGGAPVASMLRLVIVSSDSGQEGRVCPLAVLLRWLESRSESIT